MYCPFLIYVYGLVASLQDFLSICVWRPQLDHCSAILSKIWQPYFDCLYAILSNIWRPQLDQLYASLSIFHIGIINTRWC